MIESPPDELYRLLGDAKLKLGVGDQQNLINFFRQKKAEQSAGSDSGGGSSSSSGAAAGGAEAAEKGSFEMEIEGFKCPPPPPHMWGSAWVLLLCAGVRVPKRRPLTALFRGRTSTEIENFDDIVYDQRKGYLSKGVSQRSVVLTHNPQTTPNNLPKQPSN